MEPRMEFLMEQLLTESLMESLTELQPKKAVPYYVLSYLCDFNFHAE